MKQRIDWSIFAKKWPYFLVFLILNCVLWVYIGYLVNDPKDTEIFYLFIGAYDTETGQVKSRSSQMENFPYLRRYYVKSSSLASANFKTDLNTYGLVHSDLLILAKSTLDSLPAYSAICASFSNEYADAHFEGNYTYLTQNELNYGIKVYDKDTGEGLFSDIISYTAVDKEKEDYYLVFKTTSIHLGDMESGTKTDYAIRIAKGLLKYEA